MYLGPHIDDRELLDFLPAELQYLLERANGYIAYQGGLHVRGACLAPGWHSLRAALEGPDAFHALYPAVDRSDLPFAEDAFGDQYLLRAGTVHRLSAETGEIESTGLDVVGFDAAARADPVAYLSLAPLETFRAQGGNLQPGELLNVYPPFVAQESAAGVSFRAVPALEQRRWLADLAQQIQSIPDGAPIRITPLP